MKKTLLVLLVISSSLFGFNNNPKYPVNLNKEYIEIFESEFLMEMNSSELIVDIETKFIALFDQVNQINAQYSEKNGHYYLVFGQKDGKEKIELLKIEEEDIENQSYSYIDFDVIQDLKGVEYCVTGDGNFFPKGCPTPNDCVNNFTGLCRTIICGIWNGNECIRQ